MENQLLTGGREGKIALNKGRIVRPANPWTKDVHAFLRFLKQKGFENVPVPYGVNGDGKEEVSFVEGVVYNDCLPDVVLREDNLLAAARLLRRYHDAGAEYAATLAAGKNAGGSHVPRRFCPLQRDLCGGPGQRHDRL